MSGSSQPRNERVWSFLSEERPEEVVDHRKVIWPLFSKAEVMVVRGKVSWPRNKHMRGRWSSTMAGGGGPSQGSETAFVFEGGEDGRPQQGAAAPTRARFQGSWWWWTVAR